METAMELKNIGEAILYPADRISRPEHLIARRWPKDFGRPRCESKLSVFWEGTAAGTTRRGARLR